MKSKIRGTGEDLWHAGETVRQARLLIVKRNFYFIQQISMANFNLPLAEFLRFFRQRLLPTIRLQPDGEGLQLAKPAASLTRLGPE